VKPLPVLIVVRDIFGRREIMAPDAIDLFVAEQKPAGWDRRDEDRRRHLPQHLLHHLAC
jgi:hypothetical protein